MQLRSRVVLLASEGRNQAAPAVPRRHRQPTGTGMRALHRRLEACSPLAAASEGRGSLAEPDAVWAARLLRVPEEQRRE